MLFITCNLYSCSYECSVMKWSTRGKIQELSTEGMYHIIAKRNDRIACFSSVLSCKEEDLAGIPVPVMYIYELHVLPEFQRLGLGAWLLDHVLVDLASKKPSSFRDCTKMMLTVQTSNTVALSFYKKHDFAPDEICPSQCLTSEETKRLGYMIMSRPIRRS